MPSAPSLVVRPLAGIVRPLARGTACLAALLVLAGCAGDGPGGFGTDRPQAASGSQVEVAEVVSIALGDDGRTPAMEAMEIVDAEWIAERYTKREVLIPMRDGIRLHTSIYEPRTTEGGPWPFLMKRTPYSSRPYGSDAYPNRIGPADALAMDGYIFVVQDVRGCWMSEGDFVNMTPHVADKRGPSDVDESTDTYDTIEWLIANVANHNGRVGTVGTSYPGFYAAAGMIDAHPALVAVSPQAPIADWWYDDFKHHGAFFMPHAFHFMSVFGQPRPEPTTERPGRQFEYGTPDGYAWYLEEVRTPRALEERYLKGISKFWSEMIEHPDRDEFWTSRDILPHLRNVAPAVLTVGGWFDAEDLYGPLNIYARTEAYNPNVDNRIIMGPWVHGGWHRTDGNQLGDVNYGDPTRPFFIDEVERPFFTHHLKDGPAPDLPEAMMFETGTNRWRRFDTWPPEEATERVLFARANGRLSFDIPMGEEVPSVSFVSDPATPVPFTEDISIRMTREYMVEDQRFAARRPDVVTFRSAPLEAPITIAGPVIADLLVATDREDADWVVKLIDQQPGDAEDWPGMRRGKRRGGFMQMIRSEVIRGRYREDPANPIPFVPNEPTRVELPLQDVLHTFQKGHRIVIQIQSTWFPMVDRNPQRWVDNIFKADESDYAPATHTIFHGPNGGTSFRMGVIPPGE